MNLSKQAYSPDDVVWWHVSDARAFIEIALKEGQRFRSIEIQHIEKEGINGIVVFMTRPTGELDMIVSPGLDYDRAWFEANPFTTHLKFGSIVEAPFRTARCHITPTEVDVAVDVDDASGARLQVRAAHRFAGTGAPWFFPATRGQRDPYTLRFMFASSLRLLPLRSGALSVCYDGKGLTPNTFLLPAPIALVFNARCGSGLVGAGMNASGTWTLAGEGARHFPERAVSADIAGPLCASFERASADASSGPFSVTSPVGIVARGQWRESDQDGNRQFELTDVSQNWFPGWRHPLRLGLYLIRRVRRRHEAWRWVAQLESGPAGHQMTGRWFTR